VIGSMLARIKLGNPAGATLQGTPKVVNQGALYIGKNLFLASSPVASHLITEASGVLAIGSDVAIGHGAAIYCQKEIRIGDGTRIAPYCVMADTDFHVIGDSNLRPEPRSIVIGRDVSIGARVNILPGSTIGDGAVVLAGSTVAGPVAAGAVVSGVPAIVHTHSNDETNSDVAERVRTLVQNALGLQHPPEDGVQRTQIPQWDSLGALRITLAIEGMFSISLTEREVIHINCVADLIAAVQRKA
jgi:acetyltransferase-like isoleucine patch superfamily enzyme